MRNHGDCNSINMSWRRKSAFFQRLLRCFRNKKQFFVPLWNVWLYTFAAKHEFSALVRLFYTKALLLLILICIAYFGCLARLYEIVNYDDVL